VFELWELDGVFVSRTPEEILAEVGEHQPGEWYALVRSNPLIRGVPIHLLAVKRRSSGDGPIPKTIEEEPITEEEADILLRHLHEQGLPVGV